MKHDIKLRRATKQAGFLPMATAHILRNIPDSAIDKLTGKEIAELMQAMHKHFTDGQEQASKELTAFLGLPKDVSIWAVLGDKNYLGYKTFADRLNIPNLLEARGRQVAKWKNEKTAVAVNP